MTLRGQGLLGRDCAWCGNPATGDVEVEPAVYEKGELKHASRKVPACAVHIDMTEDQPPPIGRFRQRKARGVEQLTLDGTAATGPRNAISGDDKAA